MPKRHIRALLQATSDMPLRIAVLGNSHLGGLQSGWQAAAGRFPDVSVTFYCAFIEEWKESTLEGGTIVCHHSKGKARLTMSSGRDHVPLREHDVLVVHGMFTFESLALRAGWKSLAGSATGFPGGEFPADASGWMEHSAAKHLLSVLDGIAMPVLWSPAPLRLEKILHDPDAGFSENYRAMLDAGGSAVPVIAQCLAQWHRLMGQPPFIDQPAATLTKNGVFTQAQYQTDVEFIEPRYVDHYIGAEDYTHMNGAYGTQVMADIVDACRRAVDTPRRNRAEGANPPQPYRGLPATAFWKRTAADRPPGQITGWYQRKFDIGNAAIATAGSCFAQHIGRRLRAGGFNYIDAEIAPASLPPPRHAEHGYGLYSARYGNVYTARQLLQLFDRAHGHFSPTEDAWSRDGGLVDPFRAGIEAVPHATRTALDADRARHFAAVRNVFATADIFVFTLGLTEAWLSAVDGAVFPVAPGVRGGAFDPQRHRFVNFTFREVYDDLSAFMARVHDIRPRMRFLLTVSPVPLMATASGRQVVAATMYSKSVLRAVAGQLADEHDHVDYFPSYDIVTSPAMEGRFFKSDRRTVTPRGVDFVMAQFFAEHAPPVTGARGQEAPAAEDAEVQCDEEFLAAFGPGGSVNHPR